jgi:hypothetical protein
MTTTTTEETGNHAVPTQTFYCPGCREWHETPALLEAVRAEAERLERESGEKGNDDEVCL